MDPNYVWQRPCPRRRKPDDVPLNEILRRGILVIRYHARKHPAAENFNTNQVSTNQIARCGTWAGSAHITTDCVATRIVY